MICPKCAKDTVKMTITTRLYHAGGIPVPVVINHYYCMACRWTDKCDSLKRFFCKYCGSLTASHDNHCGVCQRTPIKRGFKNHGEV